jgi:hypothetical protein
VAERIGSAPPFAPGPAPPSPARRPWPAPPVVCAAAHRVVTSSLRGTLVWLRRRAASTAAASSLAGISRCRNGSGNVPIPRPTCPPMRSPNYVTESLIGAPGRSPNISATSDPADPGYQHRLTSRDSTSAPASVMTRGDVLAATRHSPRPPGRQALPRRRHGTRRGRVRGARDCARTSAPATIRNCCTPRTSPVAAGLRR